MTSDNNPKWTPGPWKVERRPLRGAVVLDSMGGDPLRQNVCHPDLPDDRREANAHLIAAAPGLYEALANLVRINEEHNEATKKVIQVSPFWKDDYLDEARAALRLARGES